MNYVLPEELIQAGVEGNLIVLVGAGASFEANLPKWSGLLQQLYAAAKAERSVDESPSLYDAQVEEMFDQSSDVTTEASLLQQEMGNAWMTDKIIDIFDRDELTPTAIHRALAKLGATFVTTNYDRLLERALYEANGTFPAIALVDDAKAVNDARSGTVLKVHGDVKRPDSIVLSTEDFFRVQFQAIPAWQRKFESFLQDPRRMLLVGYSFNDPDIRQVVAKLQADYGGALVQPYWLEVGSFVRKASAQANRLTLVSITGYEHVAPWLDALADGIARSKARIPVVLQCAAYASSAHDAMRKQQEQARNLFDAGAYGEALTVYNAIIDECTRLVEVSPNDRDVQQMRAICRLNSGGCHVCLQHPELGLSIFVEVADTQAELLTDDARALLADTLIQMGDKTRGRRLLEGAPTAEPGSRLLESRQLLEIEEGSILEPYVGPSETLTLASARSLISRRELASAARILMDLKVDDADALLELYVEELLVTCLGHSVFEPEADEWTVVAVADRRAIVQRLETKGAKLFERFNADELRIRTSRLELSYWELAGDDDSEHVVHATNGLDASGHSGKAIRRYDDALALARAGDFDAARATLGLSDHPWSQDVLFASLRAQAGDTATALAEVQDLAARYPGRAPIERLRARLLRAAGRKVAALESAATAFKAMPGQGYRLAYVDCLLSCDRYAPAYEILSESNYPHRLRVLKRRAAAATAVRPDEATELWQEYLRRAPDDSWARLSFAKHLFRVERRAEAASEAWRCFEATRETATEDELFAYANYQHLHDPSGLESVRRQRDVLLVLRQRFVGNARAEALILRIQANLAFTGDTGPIDYKKLQEAGFVTSVSLDDVRDLLRKDAARTDAALCLYRAGQISFGMLCDVTRDTSFDWSFRLLHAKTVDGNPILRPPVPIAEPNAELGAVRLLVGPLEIHLLHDFGVLGRLRSSLGVRGGLVVFADDWQAMVDAARELAEDARGFPLGRVEQLIAKLRRHPNVDYGSASDTDVPVLRSEDDSQRPRMNPAAVVAFLRASGSLGASAAELLARRLSALGTEEPVAPPTRYAVDYGCLMQFSDAEALDSLLSASTQVVVESDTVAQLEREVADLRSRLEIADAARELQQVMTNGIMEGWVDPTLERPVEEFSPPQEATEEQKFASNALNRNLAYKLALERDSELSLLTVDSCVASPLHIDPAMILALKIDAERFKGLGDRLHACDGRVLSLPSVLKASCTGPLSAKEVKRLVLLGFTDAASSEDILQLAREYSSLTATGSRELLDGLEASIRSAPWMLRALPSLRLAMLYGDTVMTAFIDAGSGPNLSQKSVEIADVLLQRLLSLGSEVLENALNFLILRLADDLPLSMEEGFADLDNPSTSASSVTGNVWRYLRKFSDSGPAERAVVATAVRRVWAIYDKQYWPKGASVARSAPLLLALVGPVRATDAELETPSILSGAWVERPLAVLGQKAEGGVETALQALADVATNTPDRVHLSERVLFELDATGEGTGNAAAVEAVLLRMHGEQASAMASAVAMKQGRHDGRQYHQLVALAEVPHDPGRRRAVAAGAIHAPWREVRDNPMVIISWAARARFGTNAYPSNIGELRELLSEPEGGLTSEPQLREQILDRLAENGAWATRLDGMSLLREASIVPGLIGSADIPIRLDSLNKSATGLARVLSNLQACRSQTAAALGRDLYLLAAVGMLDPGPDLQLKVRAAVGKLVATLVDNLQHDAQADEGSAPPTVADSELEWLRICGNTVKMLCHLERLPYRDGLLLTFRFHGWLMRQLASCEPAVAEYASARAREVAGRWVTEPSMLDALDVFRPDLTSARYRLLVVLHALATLPVLRGLNSSEGEAEGALSWSWLVGPELVASLLTAAAIPRSAEEVALLRKGDSPSALDWCGPGALRDLALSALLLLSPESYWMLSESERIAWLEQLGASAEANGLPDSLRVSLFRTCTFHVKNMTPAEREVFERALRAVGIEREKRGAEWLWIGLTYLFAEGGAHLRSDVAALLDANIEDPMAVTLAAVYLLGIGRESSHELEAETVKLSAELALRGHDVQRFSTNVEEVRAALKQHSIED